MKNYVVMYKQVDGCCKTDLAADVVQIDVTKVDPIGGSWLDTMVFFWKVNPPITYDDISLIARLDNILSIREQY